MQNEIIAGLILSSMPELQEANGEPIQLLIYAEMICMIWFTIEYMARFVVNPNKVRLLSSKYKMFPSLRHCAVRYDRTDARWKTVCWMTTKQFLRKSFISEF